MKNLVFNTSRFAATTVAALLLLISATTFAAPTTNTTTKGGGISVIAIDGRSASTRTGGRTIVTTTLASLAATLTTVCKTDLHLELEIDGGAVMNVDFNKQTVELLGYDGVIKEAIALYKAVSVAQVDLNNIMIDTASDWQVLLAAGCGSTGRYAKKTAPAQGEWVAQTAIKQQGSTIYIARNETDEISETQLRALSGQVVATITTTTETNIESLSAIKFELPNHLSNGVYLCTSKVGNVQVSKLVTIF